MIRIIRRAILLAALLCLCAGGVQAQQGATAPASAEITLSSLRDQVEQIPDALDSDDEVKRLAALVGEISSQTEKFVAARTSQLTDLNARLGELGPPPAEGSASTEAADITRQRAALLRERNAIDADIRLARLLAVDARQRRDDAMAQRRAVFTARLFERGHSPLGTTFWRGIAEQWPGDLARLDVLTQPIQAGMQQAFGSERRILTLAGLAAALAMLLLGNLLAERMLIRLAMRRFPVGRLRRSLLALLTVLANVAITGIAAEMAWQTLEGPDRWVEPGRRLAEMSVRFAMFLAFVVGLGQALLANRCPPLRLPSLSDPMARRMAPLPWLMAWVALVSWLPMVAASLLEAPLNGVLTHLVPTLALLGAAVLMFIWLRPPKAPRTDAGEPDQPGQTGDGGASTDHPNWLGLFTGVLLLGLAAVALLLAAGFLALARAVSDQWVWTGIVIGAAYLLLKFSSDFWTAALASHSLPGQRLRKTFGFAPQTLDQAVALLSGVSRVAVFFYMVIALWAPLGSGPGELFQRSSQWGTGLKIGEFRLIPGAVVGALAVLAGGFIALRLFKRWLENSYLPHTRFEAGMRASLTTLLGYAGGILVVALSLSALGIGINRIAWVASALSVGIGFGLQAIVQNFISGLILLAEQPVKVGDWVVLGGSEGDVRRINVRATEIQLADRSTLVVPNSEFITKTVRNMTLANAEGRVLIRLPMPLSTDTQTVHDVMLGACREHPNVLAAPEPIVMLDGVENTLLIFQAIAFVPSPRMASSVRSDLLFIILQRLQAAQVPMPVHPLQPLVPPLQNT